MTFDTDSPRFKVAGHYPASLTQKDVRGKIQALRIFIGADRLKEATAAYLSQPTLTGQIRELRLREHQPLIAAFQEYDKATLRGTRPLKQVTEDIFMLASTGAMAEAIRPTLDEQTFDRQRKTLVSLEGRYRPLLLEWSSAVQVIRRHKAKLAWTPPGVPGPEFVALANGIEFEVECKRQSTEVGQLIGERERDRLLGAVMEATKKRALQGQLIIELTEPDSGNLNEEIPELGSILDEGLAAGHVDIRLADHARLKGDLRPVDGRRIARTALDADVQAMRPAHSHGISHATDMGAYVCDPVVAFLVAPAKPAEVLRAYLWDQKFQKAARACSGKRGAILMFEWEGLPDPRMFADADLFTSLTHATFTKYPHVTRIAMRCEEESQAGLGRFQTTTPVYVSDNPSPTFPEALQFMKVDLPL